MATLRLHRKHYVFVCNGHAHTKAHNVLCVRARGLKSDNVVCSPKKKAKPAAKPTVDEDSDLDVPLMPPKADPYLEKLKGHVQSVIKEQDMDLLTLRMVSAVFLCVCSACSFVAARWLRETCICGDSPWSSTLFALIAAPQFVCFLAFQERADIANPSRCAKRWRPSSKLTWRSTRPTSASSWTRSSRLRRHEAEAPGFWHPLRAL